MWLRALQFFAGALVVHATLCLGFAWVARHHDVRHMDERWLQGPLAAEVMVAGDSHARFAVEAPLLGRAINVAVPGEHYEKSMFRVPWLLDHGQRTVATVLLPFDRTSFSGFKSDAFEPEAVWGRYVDWARIGRRRGAPLLYIGKALKSSLVPYVGEADSAFQYLEGARHFRDPEGLTGLVQADQENGAQTAHRHFDDTLPWDPDQAWALSALVQDLRARGIHVVLVRYPLTRQYLRVSAALGADEGPLRDALFTELAAGGGVEQLDFERAFVDHDEYFQDGDHLGVEGKRVFTGLLAHALADRGLLSAPHWGVLESPVTP